MDVAPVVIIKVAATVTLLPTSPPESCAVALATARMEISITAPGFAARRRSRVSQQPRPHGLRPTLTSPPCCQALPTAPKTWTLSWRSMRASGCWHEQQQQQQDVAETGDTSLPHSRVAVAFTGVHIALQCCGLQAQQQLVVSGLCGCAEVGLRAHLEGCRRLLFGRNCTYARFRACEDGCGGVYGVGPDLSLCLLTGTCFGCGWQGG